MPSHRAGREREREGGGSSRGTCRMLLRNFILKAVLKRCSFVVTWNMAFTQEEVKRKAFAKQVPVFPHDVRGGKQVSSYFGQSSDKHRGGDLGPSLGGLSRLRPSCQCHDRPFRLRNPPRKMSKNTVRFREIGTGMAFLRLGWGPEASNPFHPVPILRDCSVEITDLCCADQESGFLFARFLFCGFVLSR